MQAATIAAVTKAVSEGMLRIRAWKVAANITRSMPPTPSATLSISRPTRWRA
jgi:hypothetical protein